MDKTGEPQDVFFPPVELMRLRMRLLREEYEEVRAEMEKFVGPAGPVAGDRAALAHELSDLLHVIYGTGVTLGLDLDEGLRRVTAANHTKKFDDEFRFSPTGKMLKGPEYKAPDFSDFAPVDGSAEELP